MTQPEHTPGPWHWFTHYPGERHQEYSTLQNLEGTQICDDGSSCAEYGAVIDVSGPDAKLIEQAPELLEALEAAVNFYVSKVTTWRMVEACANGFPLPENIDWPPYVVKAHSAIVKVRGSQ